MSSDDGWASALRAAIERLGPVGLIVGGTIGGAIWLESQQPGTIDGWLTTIVALAQSAGPVLAVIVVALLVSRAEERRQARAERRETAEVMREIAQATRDGSASLDANTATMNRVLDRLGPIR